MKEKLILLIVIAFTIIDSAQSQFGTLIFQSDFEADCSVIPVGSDADIIGKDQTLPDRNDWIADLDNHPNIGNFKIAYAGGNVTQRYAKIIPEPGNPNNHVLQFWLDYPNEKEIKGRVQANFYGNQGLKEIRQSVRVFLPSDFNTLRTYPSKISWLTIAEFWNNNTWDKVPNAFRITLGIGKYVTGEDDLHFILKAENYTDKTIKYTKIWSRENNVVKVPVEQWFTFDYYLKEGNESHGRFFMTIQPDGGRKEVVFDVTAFTHNTFDTNPDGFSEINPLKLYTSADIIQYMKNNGKTLQIYWDNYRLWKDKQPDLSSSSYDESIKQYVPEQIRNFPNPFTGETLIEFNLNKPEKYRLSISDMHGRSIRILEGVNNVSNSEKFFWDGCDLLRKSVANGIYLCGLQTNNLLLAHRIVKL